MNNMETELNESLVCSNAFMQLQALGHLLADGYTFSLECINSNIMQFFVYEKKEGFKPIYSATICPSEVNTYSKIEEELNKIWRELNEKNLTLKNS